MSFYQSARRFKQKERKEVQRFKGSDISQGKSEKTGARAKGQTMNPHIKAKEGKKSTLSISARAQIKQGWQSQNPVANNMKSREISNIDVGGPRVETDYR